MKWYGEIHANSRKTDQTDRLMMMLMMLMMWQVGDDLGQHMRYEVGGNNDHSYYNAH
jgi:hypothetical protein